MDVAGAEAVVAEMTDCRLTQADKAIAELRLPDAVFKTCPWQPRELITTGLRQWLRCCAPTLGHRRVIGMPSKGIDEAWHGLILCTALYSDFCKRAYGTYLHHHPEGAAPGTVPGANDPMDEQLGRTVVAWSLTAKPGEVCVMWDLDVRVGVEQPWGIDLARVGMIEAAALGIRSRRRRGVRERRSLSGK